jgi:hypothetical protein
MVIRLHGLALVSVILLASCILNPEGPYSTDTGDAGMASPELVSAYTLTQSVYLDGTKMGYLLTFLEVPKGSTSKQLIEPGTRYIKDLDFKNIGFILPHGKTYRYDERQKAVEVCQFNLPKNLAYFFGNPYGQVELRDLGK